MLSNEELLNIKGGASTFSAALFTAITNVFIKLYKLGQTVGSALRRSSEKNYCKIS